MKHIKKYRCVCFLVIIVISVSFLIEMILFLWYTITEDSDFEQKQIEMHAIPSTLTRSSISLKLVNNTDYEAMYGLDYRLEVYRRGQWRDVWMGTRTISLIGFYLLPNSYSEGIIRTFYPVFRGRLLNGRYRIIKDVRLHSEPNEIIQVAAEFIIQHSISN